MLFQKDCFVVVLLVEDEKNRKRKNNIGGGERGEKEFCKKSVGILPLISAMNDDGGD